MSTFPTSPRSALLQWCQAHENLWVTNATSIGLTAPQANAFKDATDAAAAASLAQEQARQAAKVATQTAEAAFATLRSSVGDTVKLIRAFAINSVDPLNVYNLAQIQPPAPPTPAPPPAQPTNLTVSLDPTEGFLILAWKAENPAGTSGTSYLIKRRLPGEGAFSFIGVSGTKKFVDETLVAGPDSVQYTVQGTRANQVGPVSPIFTVQFGRSPDGGFTATATESGGTLAADKALVDAIVGSKPHPAAIAHAANTNGQPATSRS
ncbi:MAG: hypothetical protein KF841_15060 [Phycisphaerae bacterium]|nr:hypothetical protein [Phycisphaerae bacterium]